MASCNFQGGKFKTSTEVKRHILHNCGEGRKSAKKKNKNINLEYTKDNFSIRGLTYREACDFYDRRVAEIDANGNTNRRRDRVTMVSICICTPDNLPEDRCKEWFYRVSEIVTDFFGGPQNFLEGFIHVDEIHDYVNAKTGLTVRSRRHGHYCGLPVVNGTLNAKKLTARANIIKLNKEVDEMTRKEFGCFFMTGEKKKSFHTVEELKEMSAYAEYEMELKKQKEKLEEERNQLRAHEAALENLKREIEEKEENAKLIHEKAKTMYNEALRREAEAQKKIQEAEEAEQLQKEMSRRRAASADFEYLEEKWRRERLGQPAPTTADFLREATEFRRRSMAGEDQDLMEEDAAQETQEFHVPFEFLPFGVHPSAEDELEC